MRYICKLYLDSAQCGQQMWVMADAATEAARLMLAFLDEVHDLGLVHALQLSRESHGGQTPVHAVHTQELSHDVLLCGAGAVCEQRC